MREANLKPWDLDDPRFTVERRLSILACLAGEAKADKIKNQPMG